jgi:uncharacterized protein (DUF1015 family)
MVNIAPFRALRYRNGGPDLSRLICPPYDVISESEQHDLSDLSPQNFVHVELPLGEPAARAENAAACLSRWKHEKILEMDDAPAFYILESTFKAPGGEKLHRRTGFFCALGLEEPGKGSIHPHERTLPKPKVERLKMLEALKMNTSPVFGFFLDAESLWLKSARDWMQEKPAARARETSGVEHRLWAVTDPQRIKTLSDHLQSKELFIADGHHRYEVAWAYHQERMKDARGGIPGGRILAYLCAMEDPGLLLLPIHRFVRSPLPQNEWNARIKASFDVRPADSLDSLLKSISEEKTRPGRGHGLGLYGWGQYYFLQLKKDADPSLLKEHYPESLWGLDAVVLEATLISETRDPASHPGWEVSFTSQPGELVSRVKAEPGSMGFFLAPMGVDEVAVVARTGQVMPPKTTFFYPKAPAGFVLYELA